MNKKVNNYLNIILVLLIIALLGYGVYFTSKQVEKKQLNDDASSFLNEFDTYITKRNNGEIVDEYEQYLSQESN